MGRYRVSKTILTFQEYRHRLGRLAELCAHDPMLDTLEAEQLLNSIAAYMVEGGDLVGHAPEAAMMLDARARQE